MTQLASLHARSVLDASPNAVLVLGRDWTIRYINREGARQLRREVGELVGAHMWSAFPEAVGGPFYQLYTKVAATGEPGTLVHEYPPLDAWFSVLAYPVEDGLAVQFADITHAKRRERVLEEQRTRLAWAQELAQTGDWSWDVATGQLQWSHETFRIFGIAAEHAPSFEEMLANYIHPDDVGLQRAAIERALACGEAYALELRVRRPDGEVRTVEARGEVLLDDAGAPVRMFGIVRDVTAAKAAEDQRVALLQQTAAAERLQSLGLLAGGVAHDFNNLLVGVLTQASVAREHVDATHPAREALEWIEGAAARAAELTRQLLAYAGQQRPALTAVDLEQLVRDSVELLRAALGGRARLLIAPATAIPRIEGDAPQLTQVAMNLIANAADAVRAGAGTVSIALRVEPGPPEPAHAATLLSPPGPAPDRRHVVLCVHDDGVGMDEATRARMFEPFFSTKPAGRGLGLASTLGIAHAHGAHVRVTSELGRGTCVELWFPAAERPVESPAPAVPPEADDPRPGLRVLVIDDEEVVRVATAAALVKLGHQVHTATSGSDAVASFVPGAFELALVDLSMPGLDGAATCAALHAADPQLRVILMSGYDADDVRSRVPAALGATFLAKPFTLAELRRAVAAIDRATTA